MRIGTRYRRPNSSTLARSDLQRARCSLKASKARREESMRSQVLPCPSINPLAPRCRLCVGWLSHTFARALDFDSISLTPLPFHRWRGVHHDHSAGHLSTNTTTLLASGRSGVCTASYWYPRWMSNLSNPSLSQDLQLTPALECDTSKPCDYPAQVRKVPPSDFACFSP